MEHLEEGIASHLPRVPYIVEHQYDHGGFHTFPDQARWYLGHNGQWEQTDQTKSNTRPGPLGSAAAFLQAWLFFGLLTEVLGPDVQPSPKDFCVQDGHESWRITTTDLPRYLHAWKISVIGSGRKSHGQLIQAQLALDQSHSPVSRYCSVAEVDNDQHWEVDPMIALSKCSRRLTIRE
jgi:hypothetical protein